MGEEIALEGLERLVQDREIALAEALVAPLELLRLRGDEPNETLKVSGLLGQARLFGEPVDVTLGRAQERLALRLLDLLQPALAGHELVGVLEQSGHLGVVHQHPLQHLRVAQHQPLQRLRGHLHLVLVFGRHRALLRLFLEGGDLVGRLLELLLQLGHLGAQRTQLLHLPDDLLEPLVRNRLPGLRRLCRRLRRAVGRLRARGRAGLDCYVLAFTFHALLLAVATSATRSKRKKPGSRGSIPPTAGLGLMPVSRLRHIMPLTGLDTGYGERLPTTVPEGASPLKGIHGSLWAPPVRVLPRRSGYFVSFWLSSHTMLLTPPAKKLIRNCPVKPLGLPAILLRTHGGSRKILGS